MTNHYRMYSSISRWGHRSLDAKAYEDNPLPLIETISEDQSHWRSA